MMFRQGERHWLLTGLLGLLLCIAVLTFSGMCVAYASEAVTGQSSVAATVKDGAAPESGQEAASKSNKAHESTGEEEHGLTHTQVMNFIWHCLNFTILAIVLVKYLRKPISDALTGRRESIKAAFDDLEAKRRDAERKYAEYEKRLAEMDAEAARISKSFLEQGEAEKAKIIAQANEAAARIKAQAELYVQQELSRAMVQLKKEVTEMAMKMAEDIIRKNLTEQDHHRLISEYLERVVTKN